MGHLSLVSKSRDDEVGKQIEAALPEHTFFVLLWKNKEDSTILHNLVNGKIHHHDYADLAEAIGKLHEQFHEELEAQKQNQQRIV